MKTKSALSWFGSDSEVAADLARMLDHCSHVAIPFVGGASIIPHLKARAILANDLHDAAINFYRVISGVHGPASKSWLVQRCLDTLSHPSELNLATELLNVTTDDSYRAWAFWASCIIPRKGRGGCKDSPKMPSVRYTANGGTNASRIRAAAADLEAWAKHFKRCEWTQQDFREFIPKLSDDPKCGLYADAPWVGAGDGYLHSFTDQDHRDLAALLQRFEKSTVVIRYGEDPLVRELYPEPRWTWIDAKSRTQSNVVRGEVWITNKQLELFT